MIKTMQEKAKGSEAQPSLQELIDDRTMANVSRAVFDESAHGLDFAAARLDQTRSDVTNKLRELETEFDKRKSTTTCAHEAQGQVAVALVGELGAKLSKVIQGPGDKERKMSEAHDILGAFERKLNKVFDLMATLNESVIDIELERTGE
jgi:hypothetical protein